MSIIRNSSILVLAAGIMSAASAFAEQATVTPVSVANGVFHSENCVPEGDVKLVNECLCKADITKAQLSGVSKKAATAINNQLSQVPERLAGESCAGRPVEAPASTIQINAAQAKYETVFQSPSILSVLLTYSSSRAGAAHPLPGSEGYTFDLSNGKTVDAPALLSQEQLTKANEFIQQELIKKYGDVISEDARLSRPYYLSDAGCENCTMYYSKDGWNLRFGVYAIAPYAAGEPQVTIPVSIIPEPETLIARKK